MTHGVDADISGATKADLVTEAYLDHVTEDAVAQRLAAREAGRLRYCHDAGAWFTWDGAIWQRDRTDAFLQRAREVARAAGVDRAGRVRAMPGSHRFMIGVERLARGDPALAATAVTWDADPYLLGTPGGTVRLRTGELLAADPRHAITRATAVTPAAIADCPRWRRFLEETTGGDGELVRFLHRFFGYALTGDVSAKALVFGLGDGGNGKSVMMNTITAILGDYAQTAPLSLVTAISAGRQAADLAKLRGTRLVTIAETEGTRPWAEARLKLLTGGDRLSVGGQTGSATFKPTAKLFLVGNEAPVLCHIEEALWKRIRIIPFTHKPSAPDPALETKLEAEWPGILRWMIDGCLAWQTGGLGQPARVKAASVAYFRAHDLIEQFLTDRCEFRPECEDMTTPAGALFAAWRAYATAAQAPAGSPRTFAESLQAHGVPRDRIWTGRIFRGVRLRDMDRKLDYRADHDGMSA